MRYYSTQRPVTPGSYPQPNDNNILNIVNFDDREYCSDIKRYAWGYIDYEYPLSVSLINQYELVAKRNENETFENIEDYMTQHDFIEADKVKVRNFLKEQGAVKAMITRTEIRWFDKNHTLGRIGRGDLGLQDNFV